MRKFLRFALALAITFLSIGALAQKVHIWQSGKWVVPVGIKTITLKIWGAGGSQSHVFGAAYAGGGGAFVQSVSIPVTAGQQLVITIGKGGYATTLVTYDGEPTKVAVKYLRDSTTDSVTLGANGGRNRYGGFAPAAGGVVAISNPGGNGGENGSFGYWGGGGAAGDSSGAGANGTNGDYEFLGTSKYGAGGTGKNGAGSGANGNGGAGFNPGGGGQSTGGNGGVIIDLTGNYCSPANYAGTIGNAHTVAYPPELTYDYITNITNPNSTETALAYKWQKSTDAVNWVNLPDQSDNARFADTVIRYSSQYTPTDFSAKQALGAPNVYPNFQDNALAWAPHAEDSTREFIELGYSNPAPVNFIDIYETYKPGSVDTVYVKNPNTGNFDRVYQATAAPAGVSGRILHITFPTTSYPVNQIRIAMNSAAVPGWSEIDAVKIGDSTGYGGASAYRFDRDSIQVNTYYRRGTNACSSPVTPVWGGFSNHVLITVFALENPGRNGKITGYVTTLKGTKIFGRKVFITNATPLKGRAQGFLDSAFTDEQGKFTITNIFYGGGVAGGDSNSVRFRVFADTTGGHRYKPASTVVAISKASPDYALSETQPLIDTTVFAITGQVYQICKGCLNDLNAPDNVKGPLDSVHMVGTDADPTKNIRDSLLTAYINPPGRYGEYAFAFQEPDVYNIVPKYSDHKFVPAVKAVLLSGNIPNVDFEDTTTHVISGYFTAGCRDSIGSAVLEFEDSLPLGVDSLPRVVFRRRVTTGRNGFYSVRLPARKYRLNIIHSTFTINDPVDPTLNYAAVQAFFQGMPDSAFYRDITTRDAELNLTYQRAPKLSVTGLLDSNTLKNCPGYKNYIVWPQAVERRAIISVYQGPVEKNCPLHGGSVILSTSIQQKDNDNETDTLPVINAKATKLLKALQPFTLPPYNKNFSATYKDAYGRITTLRLDSIVVTGVATAGNPTFVTVSPQIPLLVLHDPPGSNSFASRSTSVSSAQALSFRARSADSKNVWTEVKIGSSITAGLGISIETSFWGSLAGDINVTNTNVSTDETVVKTTSTNYFQTSASSTGVGPDADLFYGAALNLKYTVGSQVDWDSANCVFKKKNVMIFAPDGIKTAYVYTAGGIRDIQIPKLLAAAVANPDSAAYFTNQAHVWQQLLDNNARNLRAAPIDSNISFNSGPTFTHTSTYTSSSTNTYDFDVDIDKTAAFEAGFEIGGSGAKGGAKISMQMSTGESTSKTAEVETTTSYTLSDDSPGDLFTVNIKKDPIYATPMFETVAGESSCPHEEGTVPLDSVYINAPSPVITGLTRDTASFAVYAGNFSIDPNPRQYKMYLNPSSNPDAATVKINGADASAGILLTIKNGSQQRVTVNVVRNTAGGVYDYHDLELKLEDNCGGDISRSAFLSVDFATPGSGVNLITPVNNWLANMASNNRVPIRFNSYDTSRVSSISIEYSTVGDASWIPIATFGKASLGNGATGKTYNWNIGGLPDGAYGIRLLLQDASGRITYSPSVTGIISRIPPALYGTPQPSNSIYTAGTQISFSYTENILDNATAKMKDITTGDSLPVQTGVFGNTMVVVVPNVDLIARNSHVIRVIAANATDLYGNRKARPDTSFFSVGVSSFDLGASAINLTMDKNLLNEDARDSITVRFTRNSPVSNPTIIYYTLGGTGTLGKDFRITYGAGQGPSTGITGAQGAIVLGKGLTEAILYIHPVKDTIFAPDKTVQITLSNGGGYTLGPNYTVTGTIRNRTLTPPFVVASKGTNLCAGDSVTLNVLLNNQRFASSVIAFSSQYSADEWSAARALGAPDLFPTYMHDRRAWASLTPDAPREFIALGFTGALPANYIDIFETYNPGAIDTVYVRNALTNNYVIVYTATAGPKGDTARMLHITFPATLYPVNGVRIAMNSAAVPGWSEIDAVRLGYTATYSTYKWSNGATTGRINVKTSGTYTVKVTDARNLAGYSAPVTVTFTCGNPAGLTVKSVTKNSAIVSWTPIPCAVKYNVQVRPVGDTAWTTYLANTNADTITGLTAGKAYQWQVASICQYPAIISSAYSVGAGFTTPSSLAAGSFYTEASQSKQTPDEDEFSASIYPNPTNAGATVHVAGFKGQYTVTVVSIQGTVLWQSQKQSGESVKIPVGNFAKGLYIVVVTDNMHTGRLKLLKL